MVPDPKPRRAPRPVAARRVVAITAGSLTVALSMSGCLGSIGKAINAVHAVVNAAHNLKNLDAQIQKGEKITYEAKYKETGGSPSSEVTFAQAPGGKYAYIVPGSSSGGGSDFVANGKNQYECSQASSGGAWTCVESAEPTGTSGFNGDPFYVYTGAYYYALIETLSVAAAFEGYTVKNSTTSVSGISLKCVSFSGKSNGVKQSDEWCITKDGILGLVKNTSSNSSNNSSFEIASLSRSPSSAIFQPPKGASITQSAA